MSDKKSTRHLTPEVHQEILRAIGRIEYGSIELVVHDGKVVQIECREKIRLAREEGPRNNASVQFG